MSYEPTNWKSGDKVTSTKLNKIENGIQGNDEEITSIKEDLNVLLAPIDLFDPETGIGQTGQYLTSTGAFANSEVWSITKYIPLSDLMSYEYSGLSDVGASPYSCFYDSNKAFLSSFKQATGRNTLTVPDGAKFVKISLRNADIPSFAFNGKPTISISEIQEEISEIDNNVTALNESMPSLISRQNIREHGIDNCAWSWWTYPQVECDVMVRNRAYFGEITSDGIAGIGSVKLDDVNNVAKTHLCKVGKDDHNGMAIFKEPTGTSGRTFMAFGFTHNEDNFIRLYRGIAEHNGDLYNNPIMIEFPNKTTYAQVFNTKESQTYSQNRLFLATRVNITEWWGVFSDNFYGKTWGTPQPIIKADRQYYVMFRETTTDGFLRMVMYSNPNLPRTDTRIRMGFFDMANGNIYNADGSTLLGSMSSGGVDYTDFDIIIDIDGYNESQASDASNEPRNRLLDVAITDTDKPCIAYAHFTNATDAEYYVYNNGNVIDVTGCGEPFYTPSVYVGGLIFTPTDPTIIYLSRKIDNISRLEKWVFSNGSYAFNAEIDRGENVLIWCIRPIIDKDGTMLFYQKGSNNIGNYEYYNYDAKAYKIV